MSIPNEAVEAATGVEIGDLNETVEAPWHLQPEEARRVLEAALPHMKEKNMSNPKVVFEAVPSRYRVENRIRDGKWVGDQCFPTLEEATIYAQKWVDNDPHSYAYRVVDTRPEDDVKPCAGSTENIGMITVNPPITVEAVRVGDETPLTLDQYQEHAEVFAIYPLDNGDQYLVAGLAGEVGEVSSIFAKHWRGDGPLTSDNLEAELGDVLWFVAMLADEIGCDLSTVAQGNLDKLADRAVRGKLKGSGDNR